MKNYCVYCHTNKIDGKRYIGITSQKPEYRWKNGNGYRNNIYFYRAIQKYGWHNFLHEILYTDLSKADAEALEIRIIKEYKTTDNQYGYNIENGGNGTEKFTDEVRVKISQALIGHVCSEETKAKISEANRGRVSPKKGTKQSAEQVEKNRISHLGQKAWNKGRPWTDEEKARCNGKPVVCIETGVKYRTMKEASRMTGVKFGKIWNHCHNKIKSQPEWQFVAVVTAEEIVALPQ